MADEARQLTMPHSIEVEQQLLGALLVNSDAYALVATRLRPEHFYEPVHARIFETVEAMVADGKVANPVTIAPHFRDDPDMAEVGGAAYLARLAASATTIVNAPDYASTVLELAQRREVLRVAGDLADRANRIDFNTADDIVSEAITQLSESGIVARAEARFLLSDVARRTIERVTSAHETKQPPETMATTGSADLNTVLGGWRRKRLYVLGGRPGMGKSAIATSLLLRTSMHGHGVALFSLEMDAKEVSERCLSDLCFQADRQVPYVDIARGSLAEWQLRRMAEAQERLKTLPFIVDERPGLNIAQIAAAARHAAKRFARQGVRLEVICVDHLGLIRASGRYAGNKVAETEETSWALKALAKDLDVAVIALIQLNRAVEGREDKRPTLSDLRWSGSVEQDADVVMFAYREAYYLQRPERDDSAEADRQARLAEMRNRIDIDIAKHRGGPTGFVTLWCDIGSNAIRDMEANR